MKCKTTQKIGYSSPLNRRSMRLIEPSARCYAASKTCTRPLEPAAGARDAVLSTFGELMPATARHGPFRIGADVGGTFTDVVLIDARGDIRTHKVPSTPPDFERAVLRAV